MYTLNTYNYFSILFHLQKFLYLDNNLYAYCIYFPL